MKRFDLIFAIIKIPVDAIMIIGAALAAYAFRYSETFLHFRPATVTIPFGDYFRAVLIITPVWILFFALNDLYSFRRQALIDKIPKILIASAAGFFAVLAFLIFTQEFFASRFIIVAAWVFSIIFVTLGRLIINQIEHALKRSGVWRRGVVVIGSGEDLKNIEAGLNHRSNIGLDIVAAFPVIDEVSKKKIIVLKEQGAISELLLLNVEFNQILTEDIFELGMLHGLEISYSTVGPWNVLPNIEMNTFAGVPFFNIKKTPLDGWGRILKRAADLAMASVFLAVLSPLLLVMAFVVRLTSSGPIIFKNERVGEDGKLFDTLKFRTMKEEYCTSKQFTNASSALVFEQELIKNQSKPGAVYKIKNDPRLTPVGATLRRWSLDELPQLWNVIRGEMSLVGPRPHQPREVANYEHFQKKLFVVKPGITGLAQISGRSDLSFTEEARLDSYYIDNWSPKLDLYILLKTVGAVISRKGSVT